MLQAQTLPDEGPPMGKIHPFSKIAVTFDPVSIVEQDNLQMETCHFDPKEDTF